MSNTPVSAQDEARRALANEIERRVEDIRQASVGDQHLLRSAGLGSFVYLRSDLLLAALRAPSPERAADVEPLLREASPTLSRAGQEIRLYCPDGTITDDLYDALEAAISLPVPADLDKGGEDA